MIKLDLKWRVLITVILVGAAVYMMYPPLDPDGDGPKRGKINLGLDLQGGMHMVMDVKTDEAIVGDLVRAKAFYERYMTNEKIENASVAVVDTDFSLQFTFSSVDDRTKLEDRLKEEGAYEITTSAQESQYLLHAKVLPARMTQLKDNALQQALLTIRNRIDELGVSEPIVQQQTSLTQGAMPRILIQLPGVKDIKRAKDIIGRTALLEFKLVVDGPGKKEDLLEKYGGKFPRNSKLTMEEKKGQAGESLYYLLEKDAEVTGADLDSVQLSKDQYGQWAVSFTLSRSGGKKFAQLSAANMDRQLAIVLDDKVQSAPVIRARIARDGQITGDFTAEEANDLMIVLRSGALPASVIAFEERVVGASLGQDSIRQGINSMLIGAAAVIIFMSIWYKTSGLLANIGMICTLVLMLGALASLHATLTLPGIAGIILTLGMAVDANVLIYERIREELRQGKSLRTAVSTGYARAFLTIFDSNVTTLFAAVALLQFGAGPIRGFAVTLSIGIVASMFAQIFIVHMIMDVFLSRPSVNKISI